MRVISDGADSAPAKGGVAAIGNFDGVHRGHRALIAKVIETARSSGGVTDAGRPAGVIVFEPHPREFFVPGEPHFRLTPLAEKLRVLAGLELDFARVLTFDAALSQLSAEAFVERILVGELALSGVVVGYDFFFGHKRSGSPQTLSEAGRRFGFTVDIVPPVAEFGEVFSSSSVRLKLAEGDVAGAAKALGRPWRVTGRVIGGAKRGTGMGYPTANIPMPRGTALAHGIFAVRMAIGEEDGPMADAAVWHDAAAYLGTRPTFDDGKPVLEVFVLDFDGDLYGRDVAVDFIDFIRPDRKFDSAEALVAQMDADVARVRAILAGGAGG